MALSGTKGRRPRCSRHHVPQAHAPDPRDNSTFTQYFSWRASSCRRPFIALSPGMVNGGIIPHHEFKAAPPLLSCCATRGESRRGSSVSGGRAGHQPPSGVRVIVPEATPDMQRKINETKEVFVKMHLQGNGGRECVNNREERREDLLWSGRKREEVE